MKKCPYCAEEIQDAAIICRFCSRDLRSPFEVAAAAALEAGIAPDAARPIPPHKQPMLVALAGAALLGAGVFLPLLKVPLLGSLNYFASGHGDGTLLLLAAVISSVLAVRGLFQWLLVTGLPSVTLLLTVLVQLQLRIAEMNRSLRNDLKDNPFAGLAEAFVGGVQIEYGWAVLLGGASLLVVAAFLGRSRSPAATGSTRLWLGLDRSVIIAAISLSAALAFLGATLRSATWPTPGRASGSEPSTVPEEPSYDFSRIVQTVAVEGRLVPKNIEQSQFSDSVVIEPILKNVSGKTIVGIRGTVSVLDGFGHEVGSVNFKDADKLPTGENTSGGYRFDDNPFIKDEPYDKFAPPINGSTARYKVIIREVAFEDGSVLPRAR